MPTDENGLETIPAAAQQEPMPGAVEMWPAVIEVTLRAVVDGPASLCRYEVEVREGESRILHSLTFGWHGFSYAPVDQMGLWRDAVQTACSRVSPF